MSHDADVLNRLAARLRGASGGYRRAGADGPGLSDVFAGAADAHDSTAGSLEAVSRALGGAGGARTPDLARHAWADLPSAVVAGPRALAEAVERTEAELLGEFQTAMDDAEVSGPVRDAVLRGFGGVKAGHDRALQRLKALAC